MVGGRVGGWEGEGWEVEEGVMEGRVDRRC